MSTLTHNQITFAEQFRQHVLPRLKERLPDAALAVIYGQQSYGEAHGGLWWFAWRRGASFLSSNHCFNLEGWLHQRLLAEIDRLEPLVEQITERDDADLWAACAAVCAGEASHVG